MPTRFRPGFLLLILLLMTGGCAAPLGDFDRPRSSLIHDEVLPFVGDFLAMGRAEPVSNAPFTDDERELRDLAYAILMPPNERSEWERGLAEMRRTRIFPNQVPPFDPHSYADSLLNSAYRSSTARYARMIEDVRADNLRANPFFATAQRVVEMDTVRERGLARIPRLSAAEYEMAMARVAENRMLIGWVYRRYGERVNGYRLALERLVIATPAPAAVGAERALRALEERLARIPVMTQTAAIKRTVGK